jgi:hypothetical protein
MPLMISSSAAGTRRDIPATPRSSRKRVEGDMHRYTYRDAELRAASWRRR